jgi:glycosidase
MWIVGEVWGDGSPWLGGDQWDSVMNYQFREACVRYFAQGNTSSSDLMNRLMALHTGYAPQVSRNMMNLLSSHDTPRFLTLSGNNADLHRLAATLQFTWVGAPSVYYGEELGMQGGADPDNRRAMQWELATPSISMLRHYKRLIALRNGSRALQSGDPRPLLTDNTARTVAFARVLPNDVAVVALNRSDQARTVTVPVSRDLAARAPRGFTDGLSKRAVRVQNNAVRLTLPPLGAAVLLPSRS